MGRDNTIPQSASLTAPFTQGGLVLGITGGTGSGKTTLLDVIRAHGGRVLDCDAIYHQLLQRDKALLQAIESRFPGVVEAEGLNRKKLGNIVFSDKAALEDLNRITHSAVKQEVLCKLQEPSELVAIDAIGLFEGGLAELCQVTVAVTAPLEMRINRLMARDGITEEYAKNRIAAQRSDAWFREKCDHMLINDGSKEAFEIRCLAFLRSLGIMKEKQ